MKSMNFKLGAVGKSAPSIRLSLDTNQTASTSEARGLALECVTGSLWITFENGRDDYLLGPGERLPVNAGGRLVLQALIPSEAVFVRPADAAAPVGSWRRAAWHPGESMRTFLTSLSGSRVNIDAPI